MSRFDISMLDKKNTKVNSLEITEDHFNDKSYEYKCSYDIEFKFINVKTDNPRFNQFCVEDKFRGRGTEIKTFTERPKELSGIVTPEDDKEGTVDEAIRDYIEQNCKTLDQKFYFVVDLMSFNIPEKVFEDAYNGKMELIRNVKVRGIEYDYRKMEINYVTVLYDDNSSITVELKNTVTNRDVSLVVPDMTLIDIYSDVEDWLNEDYEGTLEILKEVFKFDLVTLKGARDVR